MEEKKAYMTIDMGEKGTYDLSKPTFEVYASALAQLVSKNNADLVRAGKVVFDSCYLGNNLLEIQEDVPLYSSLCFHIAVDEIQIYQGEIKKN